MPIRRRAFALGALALGCAARVGDAKARPPRGSLRVLTLNVAHGRGRAATQSTANSATWFRANLDAVAAVLRRESADVVALQEAELGSRWAGGFDHVEHLARAAGYAHHVAHAHMHVPGRWRYGTAILSRRAIVDADGSAFAAQGRWRKGWSRIAIDHDGTIVDVFGLHLDFARARTRRAQVDELAAMLAGRTRPRVVMGDFNAGPRDAVVDGLCVRAGLHAASDQPPTHPGSRRRIDWILVSTSLAILAHATPRDAVSDHLPVVADLAQPQLLSRTTMSSTFHPPAT